MSAPLEALYAHVVSLAEWIGLWPELPPLLDDFSQRVRVASRGDAAHLCDWSSRATTLQQVLQGIHVQNLRDIEGDEQAWRYRNIFSLGKVLRKGVLANEQLNPTTAAVSQSRDWRRIFDHIGADRFFLLFHSYSVFLPLDNACWQQVSGAAAGHGTYRHVNSKQPVDVRFDRASILFRARAGGHTAGWPSDHPFTALKKDMGALDDAAAALLCQIFARHQGHPSALGPAVSTRPPKLLQRDALPLIKTLLRRGATLKLRGPYDRACPSRLPRHELDDEEKEAVVALATQEPYAAFATEAATQAMHKLELRHETRAHQPCFLDFACHAHQVSAFVQDVVRQVVPTQLLGSRHNVDHFLRFVDIFVRSKRGDVLSLQAFTDGFRVTECPWLHPVARDGRRVRLSVADARLRAELAHDMLHWLVDGLVLPLLRFNFFATDSSATRNRLHYFRGDDWRAICDPVLARLKDRMHERVPNVRCCDYFALVWLVPTRAFSQDVLPADALGSAAVRLLPKDRGMRPIANLGQRPLNHAGSKTLPSINDKLADARTLLQHEQDRRPDIFGASIFTPDALGPPLRRLKASLQGSLGTSPVYFAKVDIKACFDTIKQARLQAVLSELIDVKTEYRLARRGEVSLRNGRVIRSFNAKSVVDGARGTLCTEDVVELARQTRMRIFADKCLSQTITGRDLLALLNKAITGAYVRFGDDLYRQKEGIPQGSCISTILCSLFYAHLERTVLASIVSSADNLLLRLLDDFLLITPREADAQYFVRAMLQSVAPYGAQISREKSVVNFELPKEPLWRDIHRVPLDADFAWCGFVLDQRLDVRIDFGRLESAHMSDTVTASSARHPGKHFLGRLYALARSPMIRTALDGRLNSRHSVRVSLFQVFQSLALRMWAYARARLSAARGAVLHHRHRLLVQAAVRLVADSRRAGLHIPANVDRRQVAYLGLAAFGRAWSRKGREGQLLVAELRKALRPRRHEEALWARRSAAVLAAPSNRVLDRLRF